MLKIDGVAFFTPNRGRLANFYRDVMGLPIAEEAGPLTLFAPGAAHGVVGIFDAASRDASHPAFASETEIWFQAQDVDDAYASLQSAGADLLGAPQDYPFGRAFWLRDPEGHVISVFRPE